MFAVELLAADPDKEKKIKSKYTKMPNLTFSLSDLGTQPIDFWVAGLHPSSSHTVKGDKSRTLTCLGDVNPVM